MNKTKKLGDTCSVTPGKSIAEEQANFLPDNTTDREAEQGLEQLGVLREWFRNFTDPAVREQIRTRICEDRGWGPSYLSIVIGNDPGSFESYLDAYIHNQRILGMTFKKPTSRPQPKIEAYYDTGKKEYLIKNDAGRWLNLTENQFKRFLRARGINDVIKGSPTSPADKVILHIQNKYDVGYAGPLAGRQEGFYEENGLRLLVTSSPRIVEAREGNWDKLNTFLVNLLAGNDEPYAEQQWNTFNGWLATARQVLKQGYVLRKSLFQPGQTLALAGEANGGKSLLQAIITEAFGGRTAKAAMWIKERTDFNAELFGAEHLMLEDETASTSYRARMALAAMIKNIVANRVQPCHPKHKGIINLAPWWRMTISLNDEPDHMLVLPPLDVDMEDKIILLRAIKTDMPMPTESAEEKAAFWAQLMQDLPGWLWWLEHEFSIPAECRENRFGVKAFHHPALLQALDELSPAFRLLGLIDLAKPWGLTNTEWDGSAEELRFLLMMHYAAGRDASKLLDFPDRCGRYLGELSRKKPDRVKNSRTGIKRSWTVYQPPP